MIMYELQMYLNTNIDLSTGEFVLFNYSMIYGNGVNSTSKKYNLPFFSETVNYNNLPNINYLTYPEIITLFFDKRVFQNTFGRFEETDKRYNETNIMKMLSLLFPIKGNKWTTSSRIIFPNMLDSLPLPSIFGSFFRDTIARSFLKVDNTVYTVSNVIYVNDIINHPKYRGLMNLIKTYYISGSNETAKLLKSDGDVFVKELRDKFDPLRISEINTKMSNIESQLSGITTNVDAKINIKTFKDAFEVIETAINNYNGNPNDETVKNQTIEVISAKINQIEKVLEEKVFNSVEPYFRNILKISKKTQVSFKVRDFYSRGAINIDNTDDLQAVANVLNNFRPYKNVVDKIKEFIEPNLVSKNDKLQNLIVNYSKNLDPDNNMIRLVNTVFQLLKNAELNKKMTENKIEPLEFDLTEFSEFANINNSVYLEKLVCEVYLNIDLVEGEDTVIHGNCKIKGEVLGNLVEDYMNPKKNNYELTTNRIPAKITGGRKKRRSHKTRRIKRSTLKIIKKPWFL